MKKNNTLLNQCFVVSLIFIYLYITLQEHTQLKNDKKFSDFGAQQMLRSQMKSSL